MQRTSSPLFCTCKTFQHAGHLTAFAMEKDMYRQQAQTRQAKLVKEQSALRSLEPNHFFGICACPHCSNIGVQTIPGMCGVIGCHHCRTRFCYHCRGIIAERSNCANVCGCLDVRNIVKYYCGGCCIYSGWRLISP